MNVPGVEWIELLSTERERLERLAIEHTIHPLAVEDCLNSNQRAKFEDFENHQLLVWFAVVEGEIHELEFVVFPMHLILVTNSVAPQGKTWREFLNVGSTHHDANHMLHQALDHAMDLSVAQIHPLINSIDEFEEQVLTAHVSPKMLMDLKRRLSLAEFSLSSLASVVGLWQRFLNPKDDLRWRLRDLWDHCERTHLSLIRARTQIAGAFDVYWGISGMRANDQIKKLTLITAISVPLMFWTSFFGMNFEHLPFRESWLFYGGLGAMVVSVVVVVALLRREGYLREK